MGSACVLRWCLVSVLFYYWINGGDVMEVSLRHARIALGLTQREVADQVGIGTAYYAAIERGERQTSVPVKRALSHILQIKVPE